MPYPLTGPQLFEVQIVGTLHQQTTRNVFHYAKTDSSSLTDGDSEVGALLTSFKNTVFTFFQAVTSQEWSLKWLQGQIVKPSRYVPKYMQVVPASGLVTGECLPSGCSVIIATASEYAGRAHQGRKYIPGIPVAWELNSTINPVNMTGYSALATQMKEQLTGTTTAWSPWIGLKPSSLDSVYNNGYIIRTTLAKQIIRYQRRREVAVGE